MALCESAPTRPHHVVERRCAAGDIDDRASLRVTPEAPVRSISSSMPYRQRMSRRRRPEWNGRNTEIATVLLLNSGHVDDADLEVLRFGIERRQVKARVNPIDLLPEFLIEAIHRAAGSDFNLHASIG